MEYLRGTTADISLSPVPYMRSDAILLHADISIQKSTNVKGKVKFMSNRQTKLLINQFLIVGGSLFTMFIVFVTTTGGGLPTWVTAVATLSIPFLGFFFMKRLMDAEKKHRAWIEKAGWSPSDDANRSYMLKRLVFPHSTFKNAQEAEAGMKGALLGSMKGNNFMEPPPSVSADSVYFKKYEDTDAFVLNHTYTHYIRNMHNNDDSEERWNKQTEITGVMGLELPYALPYFHLKKEDVVDKIKQNVTAGPAGDLEVESYEFNRKWKIFRDDDRYAHSILTPTVIDLLNKPEYDSIREIVIINGMIIALRDGGYDTDEVATALNGLYQLGDTIPDFVWKDYGKANPAFGRMNPEAV